MNALKSKFLPILIIIGIFWGVTAFYFSPLFQGKKIEQHDINQWLGGAHEMLSYEEKSGEPALWTNSMFGGMPTFLVNNFFTANKTYAINTFMNKLMPYPGSIIFIALVCAFVLLLSFEVNIYVAAVGAVIYAFASFNLISIMAGHNAKVVAIAYLPLAFAGLQWLFNRKYILGFLILALGVAMELVPSHFQITYYQFIGLGFFGVFKVIQFIQEKEFKHLGVAVALAVAGVVFGVLPSVGKLLSIQEYGQYSIRGKSELKATSDAEKGSGLDRDYAFAWSQGKSENFTYVIPNLFGGASSGPLDDKSASFEAFVKQGFPKNEAKKQVQHMPLYWGDQSYVAGPIYLGAIACFLFVLGLMIIQPAIRNFLIALSVFGLILSMGKNLAFINNFFFDYLPGFNKFRTPAMAVTIPQFCVALGAGLGLQHILFASLSKEEAKKKLLTAFAVVGGFCGFILLLGGFLFSFAGLNDDYLQKQAPWLLNAIIDDRKSLMMSDAFRSLFFISVVFGFIYAVLLDKVKKEWALIGIVFFALLDLWLVDTRYLNDSNYTKVKDSNYFEETVADKSILADKSHYRVFNVNNPFNEARTSYHHHSLGGYHGAKMRRYQDLIDQHLSKNNLNVLKMLNTKYVITDPNQPAQAFPGLGNAWFVSEVKAVQSPDEELAYLGKEEFNPENVAVVDQSKFKTTKQSFTKEGNMISLVKYEPNTLNYKATVANDGLAVFSEIYYPKGWKVTVDGKVVEHIRVNYVLRALELSKGQHDIVFTFEPETYYKGEKISLISSYALIAMLVLGFAFLVYKEADQTKK